MYLSYENMYQYRLTNKRYKRPTSPIRPRPGYPSHIVFDMSSGSISSAPLPFHDQTAGQSGKGLSAKTAKYRVRVRVERQSSDVPAKDKNTPYSWKLDYQTNRRSGQCDRRVTLDSWRTCRRHRLLSLKSEAKYRTWEGSREVKISSYGRFASFETNNQVMFGGRQCGKLNSCIRFQTGSIYDWSAMRWILDRTLKASEKDDSFKNLGILSCYLRVLTMSRSIVQN
jgi:hypothetical protein